MAMHSSENTHWYRQKGRRLSQLFEIQKPLLDEQRDGETMTLGLTATVASFVFG